ncbi:response regulator [Desulfatirhabdium butyrativorans]|uniref:response regulator n=1 Tax=Desulfatirhabdium butyrativorans TaxID=340467 RepID=UPI0004288D55|nr:response regulator [Desulfatirhabdium butyrativorans]
MKRYRVLVVDDEADFLETLVIRLNRRGFDTVGVGSGEQAIETLKTRAFDVIVLDIKMPGGMDGIETLREIKRNWPEPEVILLTGHGSIETSIEGVKLGAFDYLLKPVRIDELLEKMALALEKQELEEEKE